MRSCGASLRRASFFFSFIFWATPAAVFPMSACSSTDDVASPWPDGGSDAGGPVSPEGSPIEDAGNDAAELDRTPPYDFAVKCTGEPCVTRIAARGGAHACAVLQDGSVRCWGANASGQLGTGRSDAGSMAAYEAAPRQVLGVANATDVVATGSGRSGTSCVVSGGGVVACFGSDVWGQLGRGSSGSDQPYPEPAAVDGLQAKSVTLTNTFALAIGADNRLWSWGANDARQLARTTQGPETAPAHADRVSNSVRSCAGTSTTGFVVSETGDLLSWGGGTLEQLGRATSVARDPVPTPIALSDVSSVAAGAAHACALRRGRVHCWGQNEHGQLGTGRKAEEVLPVRAVMPQDVYAVAVAAGGDTTCILTPDGSIYCWGANNRGQIGTSSGLDQASPSRIAGLTEQAVGLAVMDESVCALLRSGSVACWGDNLLGQLGRGTRDAELHTEPGPVALK